MNKPVYVGAINGKRVYRREGVDGLLHADGTPVTPPKLKVKIMDRDPRFDAMEAAAWRAKNALEIDLNYMPPDDEKSGGGKSHSRLPSTKRDAVDPAPAAAEFELLGRYACPPEKPRRKKPKELGIAYVIETELDLPYPDDLPDPEAR